MFTWEQPHELIIDSAPWELLEPMGYDPPENELPVVSFDEATTYLRSHVARHGEIIWSELHWPEYPHIVLGHASLTWTSVHLVLRKST